MQRHQFVITIEDPRSHGPEWEPEAVEAAVSMFYCTHRDKGVVFRVEEMQTQMSFDLE